MNSEIMSGQGGFTLVELLMAMAVFSFMLLIIVVGFINVVGLHNQALAANAAQDSARSAMDTVVQGIRDSSAVLSPTTQGAPSTTLCLATASGADEGFYVNSATNVMYEFQSNSCSPPYLTNLALTSTAEQAYFAATLETTNPSPIWKPEVEVKLVVGSNNNSTSGSGAGLQCGPTNADRQFCSVVTLTSGAEPR
jgi:prepilin-type N-terminal cleavage/methylation domain-containing protein